MHITLTPDHGYLIGVAVASTLFITSLGFKVSGARSKAKVPYPYMYAEVAEAEKDKSKHIFNCTQRAHQNTLEGYPTFLVLLGCAALEHPLYAAISGAIWIVGKYFYAQGYSTGDPKKRMRGALAYVGLFALLGMSIKTGVMAVL
ncbi:hypothetical protein BASA82_001109 [Batrachochytrium salamandrivorans]|uniref:Microsomal glutathione S-transferase 3 n=1 Tax=Batrachochytrium salamandrivorans TaxID=1357716 RepID=A0ABQ8FRA7_9FUNG|nr:hypothetical protein BASA62_007496 [Batrachochytrium salamandrivorans]KAH6569789.1 hypothetical protein BASA60_008125 [Batrachochytrium salamandrivorans]KAH6580439.1 hypothetical protein BASA61_009671 [Batrachochytrium salamandrivorans]KAH6601205.1 hypothetical protein BASA50_001730 [Batrachochytrium salamandrivorans]KAH9256899.1 hypothetical protein BASA81_005014 [Batrachochytrium salamandrivorans]